MPKQSHRPTLADRIADLERQGVTNRREQAAELEMPYSTFMRHVSQRGLTRRADLSAWIPWAYLPEHHNAAILRNMRRLAQAAEQRDTRYPGKRAAAIQWARQVVAEDRDVAYDQRRGFYLTPVKARRKWHIQALLLAAERYVSNLPQLDDPQLLPEELLAAADEAEEVDDLEERPS